MACWLQSLIVCLGTVVWAQQELLQNPGFESPLNGYWESVRFTMERTSDAYSGLWAAKCTDRTAFFQGPGQLINIKPGTLYTFSSYVKQLNDMPGTLFQHYQVNIAFLWRDNGVTEQFSVAEQTCVQSTTGWFRVAGSFRSPTRAWDSAKIHFQAPDIGIDFLLDDTSLVEVPEGETNWREAADQSIQQIRMGNIHVNFTLGSDLNAQDFSVEIDLIKHHFAFGTLIRDQWMTDVRHRTYQNMVYDWFNTVTTQGVKWLFDTGSQLQPDFSNAVDAINAVRARGMRVRAHNLFWGIPEYLPSDLLDQTPDQVNATVEERLNYMVELLKGKVEHWDVMNELLHGQWFEEKFQDPFYSEHLYTEVHALDPYPKLFLNDYGVVARAEINDNYLQQATRFLSHGVPLHGLGVQTHFHEEEPDIPLIKLRLDHLSEAGLPIWVTELDVWQENRTLRADNYEKALRALFAHPSVEGIILWGFWDQHVVNQTSALVEGASLDLNEAGRRYIQLTKGEWSTHVTQSLSTATAFSIRGFKGEYEVIVKKSGLPIQQTSFSLTGDDVTVNLAIPSSIA